MKVLIIIRGEENIARKFLIDLINEKSEKYTYQYSSHLYSESKFSALKITEVKPSYDENSKIVDGREIITLQYINTKGVEGSKGTITAFKHTKHMLLQLFPIS